MTGFKPSTVEYLTVDQALRHAHNVLNAYGVFMSPAKVKKTVRNAFKAGGPTKVQEALDALVAGQEPYLTISLPYSDPVGNEAAANVDQQKKKAPAGTGACVQTNRQESRTTSNEHSS